MKHLLLIVTILWAAGLCRADLTREVQAALNNKLLQRADVGVQIVRLGAAPGQAQVICRINSATPMIPASNLKLLTTAAALDGLGADFRFRTYLVLRQDGAATDAILWADGDPAFGDAEMLKKSGWDVTTVYENWAGLLKRHNITALRHVLVDDSVFDEQFVHRHWPPEQEHRRYVAQVGGMNLNANCVDFVVRAGAARQTVSYSTNPATDYIEVRNTCVAGSNAIWLSRQGGTNSIVLRGEAPGNTQTPVSVTIHDPPLFAATVLAEVLRGQGIAVTGQIARDRASRQDWMRAPHAQKRRWTVLAVHETPLTVALARANKDSMNLYAEALLKRLGHEYAMKASPSSHDPGSWENGAAAVGAFLARLGVNADHFQIDDGSGLSRHNAISPEALTRLLVHCFHHKDSAAYMASLAIGGEDGTLSDRFRNTDLRGRVFAKSGFIAGVSALSGYVKGRDGQWYAFSIMFNGIPAGTNSTAKQIQEAVVRAIDTHAGRR